MRVQLAAVLCMATLSAPSFSAAQTQSTWTSSYTDGVVTATETDARGRITAMIQCRPPTGDLVLSDFTLARDGRRARTSAVGIGNMTVNVPSRVERNGRDDALMINLPQRPPILAGVQPTDHITVTVNNRSHTLSDGSAVKMKEVAYGCWGS
ncbi:MAG: hypothetical protein JSS00_02015 [Proteobacteria bacterium]|nr:hypothetical protein [Pseudomonadota bacterium]